MQWKPIFTQDDFFVSPSNRHALHWITQWPWPCSHVWIFGPRGCGKTHLATLWAKKHHAHWIDPNNFPTIAPGSCCIIDWDDQNKEKIILDRNLRDGYSEDRSILNQDILKSKAIKHNLKEKNYFNLEKLYAFLIHVQETQTRCLWVSRYAASSWCGPLADVNSRIHAINCVEIQNPDDVLLAKILEKSFLDIGWKIQNRWIDFLLRRMPRSFSSAADLIQLVQQHALYPGFSVHHLKSILRSLHIREEISLRLETTSCESFQPSPLELRALDPLFLKSKTSQCSMSKM